jgi:molybdopterin synthase catalytic subunit
MNQKERPMSKAATQIQVIRTSLATEPITVEEAIAAVGSERDGAVVSFSGVVRNHDGGKGVEQLTYSAHPIAEQVLREVVAALVQEKTGADSQSLRIWAAHRVGRLEIGDSALVCAVAAPHRQQAFEVCCELVDRIKAQVPIWKEQFFSDGTTEWVSSGG